MTIGRPRAWATRIADLEPAGIGRLVAEQQEVERSLGRLELGDSVGDRPGRALRVPVRAVDRHQDGADGADADGVAQLLLGLRRPSVRTVTEPAVRLDELHGGLDGALLVRAGREAEVRRVDGLLVGGQVDPRARRRHPLDADQDLTFTVSAASCGGVHVRDTNSCGCLGRTRWLPTRARGTARPCT